MARIEIIPPIEFPTSTTGSPTTSRTNRTSSAAFACTVVARPAGSVPPNPGRSSVHTVPARGEAGRDQAPVQVRPAQPVDQHQRRRVRRTGYAPGGGPVRRGRRTVLGGRRRAGSGSGAACGVPSGAGPRAARRSRRGTIEHIMTLTDRLPRDPDDQDALVEAFTDWAFEERGITLYPAQEEALLELVSASTSSCRPRLDRESRSLRSPRTSVRSPARKADVLHRADQGSGEREVLRSCAKSSAPTASGMMTGDAAVNPGAPIICALPRFSRTSPLRDEAELPTSPRSSWTSFTTTPRPTAAGRGRSRCSNCRTRNSS